MDTQLAEIWKNAYTSDSIANRNWYDPGTPEHEAHKEGAKARIRRAMTTRTSENPYPEA
jgi:hypothetical protein